ncbi:hypothetical protein [Ezakiella coagulans]|uniref:hypothetical protein n=1 Tax=Ezakiella coagulans TaxID=46507 RepID=UPI002014C24D|nr:hypothetical protein [Ezakiella coagulans]UQK60726.1 hypothetical protein M1R54_09505 [Ezakiella coagulans]
MKNIKKLSIALVLFALVFSLNVIMAAKKSNNEKCFSSKNFLVESRDTKGSTHFKIRLLKGSVATFGREKWKKGDTVLIKLKSFKGNDLEVGILPAEDINAGWGYNAYGAPIKKRVENPEDDVKFTIPNDGEYGIYVKDMKSNVISFLELFRGKEIVSTKSEGKKSEKDYDHELNNHNCIEFELEVDKKFINPLTETGGSK